MRKHANIPIFIPHLGCPNQCVFCNQRTISGVSEFHADEVTDIIEKALSTAYGRELEIAFFGGSFTGIDRALMTELLEIANKYLKDGRIFGIRCSTRPDYIDQEILDILKQYGVTTIELGLQSTSERVLSATKRGHTFEDERRACELIVKNGFNLVGQMMIGLPASDGESEEETADFIISVGASAARIYPTVVFNDTELCTMAMCGEYKPLTLDEATVRTAHIMKKFIEAGVDVIRVGLCASENLCDADTYYAGPNHPALGELVENEIYFDIILDKLSSLDISKGASVKILIPRGASSKAIGQKKKNKLRLKDRFELSEIEFSEDGALPEYCITIERR